MTTSDEDHQAATGPLRIRLKEAATFPGSGVALGELLGHAHAMRGQFETARKLIAEQVAAHEELGNAYEAVTSAGSGFGAIEMFVGDPAAAERYLSRGYRASEEASETSNLSYMAAMLANAVYAQGRHEEAELYTRISEQTAARDDYASQILWRSVRAKAFARRAVWPTESSSRARR